MRPPEGPESVYRHDSPFLAVEESRRPLSPVGEYGGNVHRSQPLSERSAAGHQRHTRHAPERNSHELSSDLIFAASTHVSRASNAVKRS
ncbi:hypothetical protein BDV37DRAFT_49762 [Aspergillus pseudonomiae]|uniref:Uncharacterized protein n=1 Tax=Aspergillus pseudonomiae TaxID=1506151 RepID=A0A5N7CVE9_9EURO|nr:uncharacterized protein BDV37DRAFT_49762 [Aspergillus pseudonomiae]KAE8397697.1 hypothetical protein BDV37DRAFT_49762 [Aspergillus pseudonomiae]